MDWLGYLHFLGHQKYGSHLLLLPDFPTGLEVCAVRIRCRSGFLPIGPPLVIRQLQRKEDEYRAANPSWVDQTDVHDDLRQQWHEAQTNRRTQFKVCDFKLSEIRMLTDTLKADWIQLPLESYLAMCPTLKQGVIAGVFKIKGASP